MKQQKAPCLRVFVASDPLTKEQKDTGPLAPKGITPMVEKGPVPLVLA